MNEHGRRTSPTHPEQRSLSSQLDRIETTVQTKTIHNSLREIHYDEDREEFRQSSAVLQHIYGLRHPATIERLENCGSDGHVYYDQEASRVIVRASHCHIRWCPICSKIRTRRISGLVYDWLMAAQSPSFITLTLSHIPDEPLARMVERLHIGFKKFRRNKTIRQNIIGGIWFLQVKRGRDKQWHAHLHIAADSIFIPKEQLSSIWLDSTGDSKIIDIQRIWNKAQMAAYVARYVSKPARLSEFSFSDAVEIVLTLKGMRLFGKFGTAAQLDFGNAEPEQKPNLIPICSLRQLANLAKSDMIPLAFKIYSAFRENEPISYADISNFLPLISSETIPI